MLKGRFSRQGIVLMCALAYFASYFSRKSFAVVMVNMLECGAVDRGVASAVGTALFIFYGLGQFISGYLGDRCSPKMLMFSGLILSAICNILLPLMPNQYLMIPVWAVNGFAQALLWPPIVRILSENLDREKYVNANLIVTCGAHASTVILYVYAPLCISLTSWEGVFVSAGILSTVVGVIFLVCMSVILKGCTIGLKNGAEVHTATSEKHSIGRTLVDSGILPIAICIIAMGFLRDGIESWLPTLYSEAFGRESSESILVSVALPIFSIISIFAIRAVHKTRLFSNEVVGAGILFAASALICIPIAILINMSAVAGRMVCLVLVGLVCAAMHACNFLLISCLPGRFARTGRASTVGGICNACTYIGAAVSMYGISVVSERLGWGATVLSWIGICILGLAFAVVAFGKYRAFCSANEVGEKA